MGKAIEHLVSNQLGRLGVERYPGQYLRIATVIQSKRLFQEDCMFACNDSNGVMTLDGIPSDSPLHALVLTSHIRLRYRIGTVMRHIYYLGFYNHAPSRSWDYWTFYGRVAQEAWQHWILTRECSRSSQYRQDSIPFEQQRARLRMLEYILAGKPDPIGIFNMYTDSNENAGMPDPSTLIEEYVPTDYPYTARSSIYPIMDRIIGDAFRYAKVLLAIDGPGYIEHDFRLNGVDLSPEVFTYPWEFEIENANDEVAGSQLGQREQYRVKERN